jgi:hypothetical protein
MSIVPPEIPALNPNLLPPQAPQAPNEVASDETSRFNYPGSDIVLRSQDSYNFSLPKLYIVICSPVLRHLIESVSNTSDLPNGEEPLPVVEVPESKETLYHLLTFIFPVTPIFPTTPEKTMELLAVAQKYEMNSVVSHIRGAIYPQDPYFLFSESALHVYFLAQQYGLHNEAVQAARVTLRLPMTIEGLEDKLDFAGMTGAYLHELWKYHGQVRTELKSAVLEFRNSGLPDVVKRRRCRKPLKKSSSPDWLYDYINSLAEDFPRNTTTIFDLTEFENERARHVQSHSSSLGVCSCATMPSQVKRTFCDALRVVIDRALERVRRISVTVPHRDS